jgi:putative hydrolase of the HAD superfamily
VVASSPLARCRAILLDWGGTLDADGEPWKARVAALLRAEGVDADCARFDHAFYAADDALVGTVPPALSLVGVARRLLDGVTRGLGVDDPALAARVAAAFAEGSLAVVRRNAPLLRALAARYRLGVVSNFYGNLEAVCDDAGVRELFGIIMDSARVGCEKPDPRIFGAALDALGVGPAEAVFVGDSLPRDMAGARGVGMPHIWLVPATPERRTACCPADPVVHSLGELEGLLL